MTEHLTREDFGEGLFDCLKAFAGRECIRKEAHVLLHHEGGSLPAAKARRLADLCLLEKDLTDRIAELWPFLDAADQDRLVEQYPHCFSPGAIP